MNREEAILKIRKLAEEIFTTATTYKVGCIIVHEDKTSFEEYIASVPEDVAEVIQNLTDRLAQGL